MNNQIQQEVLVLLSGDKSNPLLTLLKQQLASNSKKISDFFEEKINLMKAKYRATEDCRDVIIKDLKEVYETLRGVLLIARKELAFPIDEEQYATMLNQATELALADTDKLIKEIRSEVTKRL